MIALCFFPQFLSGMKLLGSAPGIALLSMAFYPGLLLIFWLATKGHICFGVSEEAANDALKSAFEKLGLKHEQLLGSIKLEDGGVFQVSLQDWLGTMQLKSKNREAGARMKALVTALKEYFSASQAGVRYLPYWMYAICGGMLLAMLLLLTVLLARAPRRNIIRQQQEIPAHEAGARHRLPGPASA